ncbi:hypothetical protein KC973_00975 [Candidatus Saccharibacteria bacterium]|nr:hypothetical protein [Candidatus Saccharibacteria bacterium]
MEPEPILPNPNTQIQGGATPNQEAASLAGEVVDSAPERSQSAPPQAQSVPQLAPQAQQPVAAAPVSPSASTQLTSSPAIADDVDVIEKEWVDKAKKIVSTTKDDPYEQEKEVSKLQADYLMKRYGKQIKIVE